MKAMNRYVLFWSPRVLSLLIAGFLSLFALDVFEEGRGFWETSLALMMHLIPTGIVLILLAIAWRWEWIGAVSFVALGLLYAFLALPHLSWIAVISTPLLLVGSLFLLDWRYRRQKNP